MDLIVFNLGVAQRPRELPQDGENTGTLPAAASANFESPPSKKKWSRYPPSLRPSESREGRTETARGDAFEIPRPSLRAKLSVQSVT